VVVVIGLSVLVVVEVVVAYQYQYHYFIIRSTFFLWGKCTEDLSTINITKDLFLKRLVFADGLLVE